MYAIRSMTDKHGLSGLQGRVINRWRQGAGVIDRLRCFRRADDNGLFSERHASAQRAQGSDGRQARREGG